MAQCKKKYAITTTNTFVADESGKSFKLNVLLKRWPANRSLAYKNKYVHALLKYLNTYFTLHTKQPTTTTTKSKPVSTSNHSPLSLWPRNSVSLSVVQRRRGNSLKKSNHLYNLQNGYGACNKMQQALLSVLLIFVGLWQQTTSIGRPKCTANSPQLKRLISYVFPISSFFCIVLAIFPPTKYL